MYEVDLFETDSGAHVDSLWWTLQDLEGGDFIPHSVRPSFSRAAGLQYSCSSGEQHYDRRSKVSRSKKLFT